MVARKRKETEIFKEHRKHLKEEASLLKRWLEGRLTFVRGKLIR